MTKQEYKEQIIKNLDKADKKDLKIIDSVVKPFVDIPSKEINNKERLVGSIVYKLYYGNFSEKALLNLKAFIDGYEGYKA